MGGIESQLARARFQGAKSEKCCSASACHSRRGRVARVSRFAFQLQPFALHDAPGVGRGAVFAQAQFEDAAARHEQRFAVVSARRRNRNRFARWRGCRARCLSGFRRLGGLWRFCRFGCGRGLRRGRLRASDEREWRNQKRKRGEARQCFVHNLGAKTEGAGAMFRQSRFSANARYFFAWMSLTNCATFLRLKTRGKSAKKAFIAPGMTKR